MPRRSSLLGRSLLGRAVACPSAPASAAAVAVAFALASAAISLTAGCSRAKPQGGAARDAGDPVTPGLVLTTFDALKLGTVPSYPARTSTRLLLARPAARNAVVAMPAGLVLDVAWETRDDLAFARRQLTFVQLKVDSLAPGVSCVVSSATAKPEAPGQGSTDSIAVFLSVEYVCSQGRSTSSLAVPVARLADDGFTRMGAATGTPQPSSPDASGATLEPVAVPPVHFAPGSSTLDAAATKGLDAYVKVLQADRELALCLARPETAESKKAPKLQEARVAAVRSYLVDKGIARTRVAGDVGSGQPPPAADDIELWPADPTCAPPATSARR